MEENHHLLRPLLPSTSTNSSSPTSPDAAPPPLSGHNRISSNSSIIIRLGLVFLIGMVSIWGNHEASKGFAITIVNESGDDTLPGKRFQLFYVSNDEATRVIIKTSTIVENFLYPNDDIHDKKRVDHITLRLSNQNLTSNVIVDSVTDQEFVLNISPSVMEGTNVGQAMLQAVQLGVARIWTWDGQGKAPKNLINGTVEYITHKLGNLSISFDSGASCTWKHDDSRAVADFLEYCERHRPGFVRRLNQGMKDEWHDGMLEIALGLPIQNLCASNRSR